ncbi:recombination regulator RecX [Alkalihalobacillus sp. MEB130]|uniref:recombination regulator RecX n=1 Tax=Alkalihalobacillus sp. MEB130 TaxID=2976704 RepID=UPI0028DD4E00|nr:recombination regulator RecX [Alkalihalobacillus sp. MEB130]MDT8860972.1 recombination regulator RecX [Alkalihalobacillus sp. MEB130]
MAVIAKIEVQKRNKSRYNIFLSTGQSVEYALSVDEDLLIKHRLTKGLEINEETLIQLIDEDEKKKAYHLAINYLSYRIRSVQEMKQYLEKKEKEPRHIREVLDELLKQGLLNDEEFAKAFIRSKQLTLMKGPLKLKQELKQKGIADETIEAAIALFSEEEQKKKVLTWLEKQQSRRSSKISSKAFKDKLSNQLLSKGYSQRVIIEAFSKLDFEEEDTEEWDAICFQGDKVRKKLEGKYTGWEYEQRLKQQLYRKGFPLELIDQYIEEGES